MTNDMKPVFESKEYGIGGHNKLEVRVFEGDGIQFWLRDGDTNAVVHMDKEDVIKLIKALNKVKDQAPDEIEQYDFTVPIHKRKKEEVPVKKRNKANKSTGLMDKSFEEYKTEKIKEAMEES